MDISPDGAAGLVTAVADVRYTPLGRLVLRTASGEGLRRVVLGAVDGRIPPAAFNSSI